jgi:rhodanese-related sulfurtransferase
MPGSFLKHLNNPEVCRALRCLLTGVPPPPAYPAQVQAKVPADAKVIVACQKGLRSLAACEQLAKAGYAQIAWLNGGFDTARKGDIATTNGVDVRCVIGVGRLVTARVSAS